MQTIKQRLCKSSEATVQPGVAATPHPLQGISLRTNIFWSICASIVHAATQWGILVMLAKLGSVEMVGQFGLAYAIGAPVIMFTGLHLRSIQATDARGEYQFGHYLGLRLLTSIGAIVIIAAVALISGYGWETKAVIIIVGLAKVIESWQDVIYGLLQNRERMDRSAFSVVCTAFLELTAITLGIVLTGRLLPALAGLIVARLAVLTTYDRRSIVCVLDPAQKDRAVFLKAMRPRWDQDKLLRLAWLALPLAIALTLHSLNTSIPRLFIGHEMGESHLGIFAALAYIMVGGNMVVMAVGLGLSPRFARYFAEKQKKAFAGLLAKGILGIGLIGLSGIMISQLAGREILTIIYRPEYAEHVDVFFLLMIGAAMAYLANFCRQIMTAVRLIRIQLPIYLLANMALIISCYYLVRSFGLIGAAWSVIISSFVIFFGNGMMTLFMMSRFLWKQ